MSLSPFTATIAPQIEAEIQSKLTALEAAHNIRILFAVESGSRAWGFPSPDSDYDVRFVYAHQLDWYLSLEPGRDVIELPLEGDWDINGWDIRKALTLLLKPNPVMLEWLSSPIRYRWHEAVCPLFLELATQTGFGAACLHHYRNLAEKQWAMHVGRNSDVALKKYFYILRPALAMCWIRQNHGTLPPMNLQALVAGLDLERSMIEEIDKLIALKAVAKEIGRGARIALIDDFIFDQIGWANKVTKSEQSGDVKTKADQLFRQIVKGDRIAL